jgi:hypothetical protein
MLAPFGVLCIFGIDLGDLSKGIYLFSIGEYLEPTVKI